MIDIHSHVLYGLDDGAPTLEDSIAMVRLAMAHGTTDLVATPHANPDYRFDPELNAQRLMEIADAVGDGLRLYSGCDFHLSYENIQDAIDNPQKYTINKKCYLLVEFSDFVIFKNTAEIFGRLSGCGMIPVITHPERNSLLRQRLEEIAGWVDQGALVQVTGQSLTGEFGARAKEFSKTLLDRGLAHFVASDGHDCQRRPPRLDQARAWLVEHYGAAVAETLCFANPRAALEGRPLGAPSPEPPPPPARKWYQFWR